MKFVKICLNNLLLIGILTSCTIIPKKVITNTPSLDSNGNETSNFLGFYTNNINQVYAVIDSHGRDRYKMLIDKYGKNDLIKLNNHIFKESDGINLFTNNTYLLQLDDLRKFSTMNRWNKTDIKR